MRNYNSPEQSLCTQTMRSNMGINPVQRVPESLLNGEKGVLILRYFVMRSGWDSIAFWVWHVTSHGLGQIDCSGEL